MSLALVTCSTVLEFIQDTKTFNNCINECFEMLDFDGNGMLSKDVLCGGLHRLLSLEYNPQEEEEEVNNLYEVIFMRFDKDKNGFIDCKEFECLIRELMLAMARGIGDSPVLVALEETSLLMKAVQHELASMNKDRRKTKKREKNVLLDICLCCHKLETS
ncbi:isoform 2 of ef-hand calcium-binding domain-containing protein 1 [Fagus crenata]